MSRFSTTLEAPGKFTGSTESPEAVYLAWQKAVESRDLEAVLSLYDGTESSLWGTLAMEDLHGRREIRTYFEMFLGLGVRKVIPMKARFREAGEGIAIANGSYAFELEKSPSSPARKVAARFTFVFRRNQTGVWQILDHHSSQFPQ